MIDHNSVFASGAFVPELGANRLIAAGILTLAIAAARHRARQA